MSSPTPETKPTIPPTLTPPTTPSRAPPKSKSRSPRKPAITPNKSLGPNPTSTSTSTSSSASTSNPKFTSGSDAQAKRAIMETLMDIGKISPTSDLIRERTGLTREQISNQLRPGRSNLRSKILGLIDNGSI